MFDLILASSLIIQHAVVGLQFDNNNVMMMHEKHITRKKSS